MKQARRVLLIVGIVFTAISLVTLCVFASSLIQTAAWRRDALPVTGTITQQVTGTSGRYIVSYEVAGEPYSGMLSYASSNLRIGREVQLYVDPANPESFRDDGANVLALVTGIVGFVFLLIGGSMLIYLAMSKRRESRLRGLGTQIMADVMDALPTSVRINNKRTYVITCQWENPQDGVTYVFKSQPMTFDPSSLLAQRGITQLPVLIDPYRLKDYWVDLSSVEDRVVVL